MAAYAALCSVMHIIDQVKHHPRPPISLYENQVQALMEKVTFLQDFLELYSHVRNEEADRLQSRIAEAAYAAEDVIESYIVDQIIAQSTTREERISSSVDFYEGLQKVIGDMDLIKNDVMEIKEKMGSARDIQLCGSGFAPIAGSSGSPAKGENIMVGFDDVLNELIDKLTSEHWPNRQIIPIVGMGGIGKTTLARNAYENPLIVQYFDVCAWITISQEYSIKEIILEVISCLKDQENKKTLKEESEEKLGDLLHKGLYDRRYLIIMDDMWNIEAWNKVKFFLPNNNNGSRVIITTRLSNMALNLSSTSGIEMNFLDEELSWTLLSKIVFGETRCPLELETTGKKIANNCKGLPLSIVVIGGLLAKSKWTRKHWEDIAENLNSIVNLEDNERCLKLLYMSYNHLSVHLKPCFLYMGVFPEDSEIHVSKLIKQWVAEGFLKPIIGKSLEEVAEEYLIDLIDRNLILILKRKSYGKIKLCKIHDLVRDFCLREAQKENFLCVTEQRSFYKLLEGINAKRRIVVHRNKYYLPEINDAPCSLSLARSLICEPSIKLSSFNFRLLRLFEARTNRSREIFLPGVNLRYLVNFLPYYGDQIDPSRTDFSFYLLWNLQTLIDINSMFDLKIWKMPQLRHVELYKLFLADPSNDFPSYRLGMSDDQNDFVLENLQTLSNVVNFRCCEKMVKIIRNIKKLRISYNRKFNGSHYCVNNLACLHKLEFLNLYFYFSARPSRRDLMQNLIFPRSLKKLTLEGSKLHWEDISTKIGSLPLLQVLKLRENSFIGSKWDTVEGQFLSLKFLLITYCCELEDWTTDKSHFPCLEHLVLNGLYKLKEIPSSIGDIPTLESIELHYCRKSAIFSAKEIADEQEQLGNESLRVLVEFYGKNQELESLASHNFEVKVERGTNRRTFYSSSQGSGSFQNSFVIYRL